MDPLANKQQVHQQPTMEPPLKSPGTFSAENITEAFASVLAVLGPARAIRLASRVAGVALPLSFEELVSFNAVNKIHGIEQKLNAAGELVTGMPHQTQPDTTLKKYPTLGALLIEELAKPIPDLLPNVNGIVQTLYGGDYATESHRLTAQQRVETALAAALFAVPKLTTRETVQFVGQLESIPNRTAEQERLLQALYAQRSAQIAAFTAKVAGEQAAARAAAAQRASLLAAELGGLIGTRIRRIATYRSDP